jgi:hypothetical protein
MQSLTLNTLRKPHELIFLKMKMMNVRRRAQTRRIHSILRTFGYLGVIADYSIEDKLNL